MFQYLKKVNKIALNEDDFYYKSRCCNTTKFSFKIDYDFIKVNMPKGTKVEEVEEYLVDNEEKILAKIDNNILTPLHSFINGEKFVYLGRTYALEIINSNKNVVYIEGNKLLLLVEDVYNTKLKENLVRVFYRENARKMLFELTHKICEEIDVEIPYIEFYFSQGSWGKCYHFENKIKLNYFLIYAPIENIRSVIIHELMHFRVSNHFKAFWTEVQKYEPNCKELDKQLNLKCSRDFCNIEKRFFNNRIVKVNKK